VHRRKWLSTSVGGAVFLSGLVMALLPGGPGSPAQPDRGAPTIPDRVAEYSHLTGSVSSSPPGRGIALFQFGFGVEFLDFPQAVVVGADGDVYRRVDLAEDAAGRLSQGDPGPMLLSPDGSRVAVGNYDTDRPALALVDLATGRVDRHAVPAGRAVLPLAWSPDGRRLAYLGTPEPWNPHNDAPIAGDAGVLELETGRAEALPGGSEVHTVAFAPDGNELAVQHADGRLEVLSLDGVGGRDLPLAAGHRLAGPAAWSPDGDLLAIRRSGGSVAFVDATGRSEDTPDPLAPAVVSPGHVLGWTAPDRVAVLVADPVGDSGPDQHRVIDVPLDGGDPRRLSAVSTSGGRYGVGQFQLAAGLLPDLQVREAGDVDRGRWPLLLRLAAALGAGAVAAGVAGLVRRLSRSRGAASA
jgi:dipeptidyl aminopeptidase/acylaminoacyl peptidase